MIINSGIFCVGGIPSQATAARKADTATHLVDIHVPGTGYTARTCIPGYSMAALTRRPDDL